MISEFRPIPEIGVQYRDKDKNVILVTAVEPEKGQNPDAVYYKTVPSSDEREYEVLQEDWNMMEYVKIDSSEPQPEPHPEPDPQPIPKPNPQPEPEPEPEPDSEPTPSDGIYSNDPRINELAKLLQDGPKKFNQEFYPTDKTLSDNNMVEHDVEDAFQKTLDEIDDLRAMGEYDHPFIEDVDENGKKIRRVNPNRKRRSCGLIQEFLWTCGGLDKSLLRMCPTDWAKKAGMGGTILGTAMLATFSGGFAINTVFENIFIAIIGGLLWGLVIFNLDRYLVNSMYSDGKPTISGQELLSGLPRIIIAVFLGIVISTPIELKIFEGKINEHLETELQAKIQDDKKAATSKYNGDLTDKKNEYDQAVKALNIQKKKMGLEDAGYLYDEEGEVLVVDGAKQRNKRGGGQKDAYKALKDKIPNLEKNVKDTKTALDNLRSTEESIIKEAEKRTIENFKKEQGLSRRLEAMSVVTSSPDSCWYKPWTWSSLSIIRFFVSLMFIILEILPVVNKMMQTDGEYDKLIDLESDTREKLTRAKEFNDINVLRSGNLSMYRNQIVFGKVPSEKDKDFRGIVDENPESQNAFVKQDYKKRNKNETDEDNYEIYSYARKRCTQYIKIRIDRIFQGVLPDDGEEDFIAQDVSKSHSIGDQDQTHDPSNEAEKI